MRQKGILSRLFSLCKEGWKGAIRITIVRSLGKRGFTLFGLPSGLTNEMEAEKREIPLLDSTDHRNPNSLEKSIHFAFRASASSTPQGYYLLKGGMATSLGGQLTSSNRLVTTSLQLIKKRRAQEHALFELSSRRLFPRVYQSTERIATLAASWQGEFYHWVHEVLPRLAIYRQANLPIEKFFVECKTAFQRESLALLGIRPEEMIDAAAYEAVGAPEIYASSLPTQPTTWSCQFLRESMQPHLAKREGAAKKVYISRQDAPRRKVLNEAELVVLLERYGFKKIVLTQLSFKEQMNVFYNAEVIVAPHGAGLSHLAFAECGIKVLEFFAPAYVVSCYWQLANVRQMEYHYLLSEQREDSRPSDPDLYLDLAKVELVLQRMLI